MLTVEKQILIDLPLSSSWKKMKDISLAHNYIPNVRKIEIVSANSEGVGASRRAYLEKHNQIINEKVIAWEEGSGFTLRLDKNGKRASGWFNELHFRYYIEAADHKTLFKPAILYQPRWNFLPQLQKKLYSCVLGKKLKVICESMKSYYETGEPTSKKKLKEIRRRLKNG